MISIPWRALCPLSSLRAHSIFPLNSSGLNRSAASFRSALKSSFIKILSIISDLCQGSYKWEWRADPPNIDQQTAIHSAPCEPPCQLFDTFFARPAAAGLAKNTQSDTAERIYTSQFTPIK